MSKTKKPDFAVWFDPREISIVANPRQQDNPGFLPHNMKTLREDIQKYGLKQPVEIYLKNDIPILIAGERRLRSILELLETEADCYDRGTRTIRSAEEVYGEVPCTITDIKDDKDRARAAVMENLLHEHLTDYEILLQCATLQEAGHTRAEQAKVFDKSEAWVSQSHSLLAGHPMILEAMRDGTLGRTQALKFLDYPQDKVEVILQKAISYNRMANEERESEIDKQLETIYEAVDAQEEALEMAQEKGDQEEIALLRRKLAEKEKEADVLFKKSKKVKQTSSTKRKPKPSINDIQQAAQEEDAANGANHHVPVKVVRRITDQMAELLESGQELINPNDGTEYSRREVRILVDAFNWFLARNNLKSPLEALTSDSEAIAAK